MLIFFSWNRYNHFVYANTPRYIVDNIYILKWIPLIPIIDFNVNNELFMLNIIITFCIIYYLKKTFAVFYDNFMPTQRLGS